MKETKSKAKEIKAIKEIMVRLDKVEDDKFKFIRMTGTSNVTYRVDVSGEIEE